jgi:hypothetical protein
LLTPEKDDCNGDDDMPPLQKNNDLCGSLSLLSQTDFLRIDNAGTISDGSRIALWHERHVAAIVFYRRHVVGGWNLVFNVCPLALRPAERRTQKAETTNGLSTTKTQSSQRTTNAEVSLSFIY